MNKLLARVVLALAAASALCVTFVGPAAAREGNSVGHGVKCYYVLVSSVNGAQTYQTVCRKGV